MTDFLNKILTLILAVVMLILGPLNMSNMYYRHTQKMHALDNMRIWLDGVADKGSITVKDLDDLNEKLAATGMVIKTKIEEFRLLADQESVVLAKQCNIDYNRLRVDGGVHIINSTNVIRVTVKEVAEGSASRLWRSLIGTVDLFEDSLPVMRR